jgi:hypothetical protein
MHDHISHNFKHKFAMHDHMSYFKHKFSVQDHMSHNLKYTFAMRDHVT